MNALSVNKIENNAIRRHFSGYQSYDNQDYEFVVVEDQQMLEKIFKIRYSVFCEEVGVFDKCKYTDGLEYDEFDSRSIHVCLLSKGSIIAYTRLIKPTFKFPFEQAEVIPNYINRLKAVEGSRTFVLKEWRNTNCLWILIDHVFKLCYQRNIEYILLITRSLLYNGLKKRGIPMCHQGTPFTYNGFKTHPLIINVHDIAKAHNYIENTNFQAQELAIF